MTLYSMQSNDFKLHTFIHLLFLAHVRHNGVHTHTHTNAHMHTHTYKYTLTHMHIHNW